MKEIQYKDFSLRTHKKNWRIDKSNVCQFELTFRCDFHCLYCYSDCYNNPTDTKNELSTSQVKQILDKIYEAGCLWLCLTGGDPLKRKDFLEIYDYAKQKGFIITIFTNGYSLTKKIVDFLGNNPPFVVELTLNSVAKNTFEEISQLPDSFDKTFSNLKMLIKRNIPVKIKTMVIKNNIREIQEIEKFIQGLGLRFNPSAFIYARLNKDRQPCSLRISPQQLINVNRGFDLDSRVNENIDCFYNRLGKSRKKGHSVALFRCAAGSSDGVIISPYGRMVFCIHLREPSIDLLNQDIVETFFELFNQFRQKTFSTDSACSSCKIRSLCYSCPGHAFLEKGDMELPIEWFCQLAHLVAGKDNL